MVNLKNTNYFIRDKKSKTMQRLQEGTPGSGCDLPVELLIQILFRVPVSSLLRFKFVCKKWLILIATDLSLPKLHLDLWSKSDSPQILLRCYHPKAKSQLTLIDAGGGHKRVFSINPRYRNMSPSFNGLICIYNRVNVMLFNPTTQQELVLPKPTKGGKYHQCLLGYTPTSKEYKVLRFFQDAAPCEILTVGTCSWRPIASSYCFFVKTGSVVINGIMYLVLQLSGRNEVVSFDLTTENFQTLDCPCVYPNNIFELEGHVCLTYYPQYGILEIWMLESTIRRDWIQKYRVAVEPFNVQPAIIQGKILMIVREKLHYLDPETGVRSEEIYHGESPYWYESQLHTESLINLEAL